MADNSSLLGGMMPTQRRTDIPTLLRGLGAAATGQVPQFRQQMRAEEQYQRQSALQDIQMQDVLAKSAAQDALALLQLSATGNTRQAMDLLGDKELILMSLFKKLKQRKKSMEIILLHQIDLQKCSVGKIL